MAKRKINLNQGGVGMAANDTDELDGPEVAEMKNEGVIFYEYDEVVPAADEDILRDENGKKLWAKVPHRIDRNNVRRGPKPLTPGICDVCGSEVTYNYSGLSETDKNMAKRRLLAHKKAVHLSSSAIVINEDLHNSDHSWRPRQY